MNLLVIGLDAAIMDPSSASAQRQISYYEGWQVDIVLLATGEAKRVALSPNVRVYRSGGANKAAALWNAFMLCRRLAHESVYDVVTAQDPLWCGLVALRIASAFRIPLHVQDHSGFFSRAWFASNDILMKPFARHVVRCASRVRTVSERGRRGLRRVCVPAQSIDVIPIATDVGRLADVAPPRESVNVLCISRLEIEKGVDVLLRAWKLVLVSVPDARLRIVGDGSQRKMLEALAQELGIATSVVFAGKGSDIVPDLAWSSIVVQPSRFEGWGMAVVEAAAAGRPVVMTDVGCAGEVIKDGESGIVVPVQDIGALAIALVALLNDPERARSYGFAAQKRVQSLPMPERAKQEIRESFDRTRCDMRSLVFAQAVDEQDALFGFFVPWLRAFAEHADAIVCALRVSDPPPSLPSNVEVHRLRKKDSRSRMAVIRNALSISWTQRKRYGSVFVRGDAQYMVICGWLWRLLGKRVVFWYTHYNSRSLWFWLAVPWAHEVVTAVPESNPLSSAIRIGHHIDTSCFAPTDRSENDRISIVIFGRVSTVKRAGWMVQAMAELVKEKRLTLKVIGTATDEAARTELVQALPDIALWEERNVVSSEAPDVYRQADVVVNATPGSLDKTIVEAAASGCIVLAATAGLLHGLPSDLHWLRFTNETELQAALQRIAEMAPQDRQRIGMRMWAWAVSRHSMALHMQKLTALLHERAPRPHLRQCLRKALWRMTEPSHATGVPVLMFHSMDGRGSAGWDVTRFAALLTRMMSAGVAVVRAPVSSLTPSAVITVDDATEDVIKMVDVAEVFQCPMTIFAPSSVQTLQASDGMSRRVLSADELRDLAKRNDVTIGGHGKTHVALPMLSEHDAREEIAASMAMVQSVQPADRVVFAYPRGKVSERDAKLVEMEGFSLAYTVQPGYWTMTTDAHRIPRLPVLAWMSSADVMRIVRGAWR